MVNLAIQERRMPRHYNGTKDSWQKKCARLANDPRLAQHRITPGGHIAAPEPISQKNIDKEVAKAIDKLNIKGFTDKKKAKLKELIQTTKTHEEVQALIKFLNKTKSNFSLGELKQLIPIVFTNQRIDGVKLGKKGKVMTRNERLETMNLSSAKGRLGIILRDAKKSRPYQLAYANECIGANKTGKMSILVLEES